MWDEKERFRLPSLYQKACKLVDLLGTVMKHVVAILIEERGEGRRIIVE